MAHSPPPTVPGRHPPGPGVTAGRTRRRGGAPRRRLTDWLRRHRYLILLNSLVAALIAQSLDQGLVGVTLAADILVGVSAIAVALVVFDERRSKLLYLGWGGVLVALGLARYALPDAAHVWLELVQKPLMGLFLGWAAAVILRDVFEQERIRTDDVVGAVSGYLLAAGAWANIYAFWEVLAPGAFAISPELRANFADWHGRNSLFNYFSLATLTTVGYGDVSPTRGPLTAIAMLETVFGQFYIAVVVAQLVGIRLAQGETRRGRRVPTDGPDGRPSPGRSRDEAASDPVPTRETAP